MVFWRPDLQVVESFPRCLHSSPRSFHHPRRPPGHLGTNWGLRLLRLVVHDQGPRLRCLQRACLRHAERPSRGERTQGAGSNSSRGSADVELHELVTASVRPQFLRGEYESAAFTALRQVEIRVRELARADDSAIGVPLMQSAFRQDGPLADPSTRSALAAARSRR
jgi:hypothetical protein